MTVRVLAPLPGVAVGKSDEDILRRVLDWLRNPGDVETLILHAPGSHLSYDRREYVVGPDGTLKPLADAC